MAGSFHYRLCGSRCLVVRVPRLVWFSAQLVQDEISSDRAAASLAGSYFVGLGPKKDSVERDPEAQKEQLAYSGTQVPSDPMKLPKLLRPYSRVLPADPQD